MSVATPTPRTAAGSRSSMTAHNSLVAFLLCLIVVIYMPSVALLVSLA